MSAAYLAYRQPTTPPQPPPPAAQPTTRVDGDPSRTHWAKERAIERRIARKFKENTRA